MKREITNQGKWINFVLTKKGDKTNIWEVVTIEEGYKLGYIKWFGRWRKYSFFPYIDTVYENICLQDIADFIEGQIALHKEKILKCKFCKTAHPSCNKCCRTCKDQCNAAQRCRLNGGSE